MATIVKKCSICREKLKDPRLLPCIHSFCLECLENYCRSNDKLPGDDVSCPQCRHEFQIPKDGVAGLTTRTHDKELALSSLCEVCSSDHRSIPATVYCIDCSQKLCERCSQPHLRMRSGPHDVKPLDAVSPEYQGGGHYCDKHKERVKLYCFDCQINVCSMCCLESHKTHEFEQIDVVAQLFVRSIDDDIKRVTSRIESFRGTAAHVEAESSKSLGSIHATESEVRKKGEEVKQSFTRLIDRQVSDLLHKLQSMKSTAVKEVKSQADAVQLALTELESFRTSSLELTSKGSPCDITQAGSDVRVRAKELLQKHVIPGEYHAPKDKFTPVNTDELLRGDHNFIGHVGKFKLPGMYCHLSLLTCITDNFVYSSCCSYSLLFAYILAVIICKIMTEYAGCNLSTTAVHCPHNLYR